MGLDMSLYLQVDEKNIDDFELVYWRKANWIHNWFVVNCADGVDECQPIKVTNDDLQKLLTIVTDVLEDHNKAPKLLPTIQGFFFGGQDYDEYYFDYLEFTKTKIEEVLKRYNLDKIYYQSSW